MTENQQNQWKTRNNQKQNFWVTCPNTACKRKFSVPSAWVFKYLERIGYKAEKA